MQFGYGSQEREAAAVQKLRCCVCPFLPALLFHPLLRAFAHLLCAFAHLFT